MTKRLRSLPQEFWTDYLAQSPSYQSDFANLDEYKEFHQTIKKYVDQPKKSCVVDVYHLKLCSIFNEYLNGDNFKGL